MARTEKNPAAERGNLAVIGAMSLLWITPTLQFWGAAFGPFRPFSYPAEDVAPSLAWLGVALAACFAPLLLPAGFYRCREGARVYAGAGVRAFRRFATNGDLVNRWARRLDPGYRVVRGRASARAWIEQARQAQRNHLVLLLMGLFTAGYAARIGWNGWALGLTAGNVVFNLYPILLQRYNRCWIEQILSPTCIEVTRYA
jgi:hypothetical protein